ncbi:MAG TPA: HEPN domain-containing protein, partial [Chloroflexi bacterium]|nr:HEPN domain-containing protein [Chloroflexota bacterium]
MNRETLIERIRAGVLAACDDVSGVILFGSFARGKPARDVDVLVVVRGARKPQRERGAQAIAIRQAVGLVGLDVDVLIYTEEEFRAGLSSRFPLLLDVAFDGQIIYGDGELRSLLQRARQDVVVRGIRRTETGGWRFPVRYRQRTSLSPVDNATWAEKWLADAERDLKAAGNLFAGSLYDRCVTHCQQVTEKSVKAVLACFGCLERSHYVAALLRREIEAHPVPGWESRLARLVDDAEQLEPAATWSRYPRLEGNQIVLPVERYEELEASEALQLAQRSLATAGDFIHWWFQEDDLNEMVETFVELVRRAATDLPADVEAALRAARDREEPRSAAAGALEAILENVALARAHSTPVCQDTGVPIFYVYHPQEISARSLRAQMEAAVAEA